MGAVRPNRVQQWRYEQRPKKGANGRIVVEEFTDSAMLSQHGLERGQRDDGARKGREKRCSTLCRAATGEG